MLPRGLRDAGRTFPLTALGHSVAIAYDEVEASADGATPDSTAISSAIATALSRGADMIALDVFSADGELYVSPRDAAPGTAHLRLSAALSMKALQSSDALLVLTLGRAALPTSDPVQPDQLARALFKALDNAPQLARNGRPIWLRAEPAP